MKSKLVIIGIILAAVLTTSAFAAPVSAIATNQWSGKGAIAQFYVQTIAPNGAVRDHTINAVLMMDNNGENCRIYVSIVHGSGTISSARQPVDCKWNMNHITVEASLTFTGTVFSGPHVIVISWLTNGAASNTIQTIPTPYGMTTTIDGIFKTGSAEMILDPTATTGHHQNDIYPSNWAAIVHGDITVTSQ